MMEQHSRRTWSGNQDRGNAMADDHRAHDRIKSNAHLRFSSENAASHRQSIVEARALLAEVGAGPASWPGREPISLPIELDQRLDRWISDLARVA